MRTLFLIVLVSFVYNSATAQEVEKRATKAEKKEVRRAKRLAQLQETDSYFNIELLGTNRSVQDQATSNQIYNGFGGGIGLGSLRMRRDWMWEYRMTGGYNLIDSQAGRSSNDFWGDFSFAYLKQLTNSKLYLGPQANFLSQVRYTPSLGNSSLHWELVGSLGAVGRYQDQWTLPLVNKAIQVYGQVHLPLIAYVSRPIYGVTVDGQMNQYVSSWNRLQRVDTEFGIFFPVMRRKDNPNLFRLGYQWDILRFRDNEQQRVLSAQHILTIGLFIKMI
ncbi:MAG: hypothetical protein AAGI23_04640 [Bacteroidota bacterium]